MVLLQDYHIIDTNIYRTCCIFSTILAKNTFLPIHRLKVLWVLLSLGNTIGGTRDYGLLLEAAGTIAVHSTYVVGTTNGEPRSTAVWLLLVAVRVHYSISTV